MCTPTNSGTFSTRISQFTGSQFAFYSSQITQIRLCSQTAINKRRPTYSLLTQCTFFDYCLQMYANCGGLGSVRTDFGCILYLMVLSSEAAKTTDAGRRRDLLKRTSDVYRHLGGADEVGRIDETSSPSDAVDAVRHLLTTVFSLAEVPVLISAAEETIDKERHRPSQLTGRSRSGMPTVGDLSRTSLCRDGSLHLQLSLSNAASDVQNIEPTLPSYSSTPKRPHMRVTRRSPSSVDHGDDMRTPSKTTDSNELTSSPPSPSSPPGIRAPAKRRIMSRLGLQLVRQHVAGQKRASQESEDGGSEEQAALKQRRVRKTWKTEEELDLLRGINDFGVCRWAKIRDHYFATGSRTNTDLKDKWRMLLKPANAQHLCALKSALV